MILEMDLGSRVAVNFFKPKYDCPILLPLKGENNKGFFNKNLISLWLWSRPKVVVYFNNT